MKQWGVFVTLIESIQSLLNTNSTLMRNGEKVRCSKLRVNEVIVELLEFLAHLAINALRERRTFCIAGCWGIIAKFGYIIRLEE